MSKAISEETKQKIIQLYEQGNLSDGMIAQAVGVSKRTVRRYGKFGLGQALPDSTRKASPAVDRPSPLPDQALDVTGRPRPAMPDSTAGQYRAVLPDNRNGWICKRCNHVVDKKQKYCPHCGSGPFDSVFLEIGSPEYERFIAEKNQLQEELEEPDNEEICDMTLDYWICNDCDYCSNNEFKICPKCKSRAVVFASDGIETRDQSKYKDPKPQDNEDSDSQDNEELGDENETNTRAVEEQQPEYEYECPKCHKEFNEVLENCPHCETQLEESWECPKCHHRWYGSPDKCPKCGAELQT
jgi:RNA polymerase subunit RPABC4/transcription elongation factor Spt4